MSEPYTPTVDEIGELLRARTKDSNGNELGTFNENTRPSADSVTALIEQATSLVTATANNDVPERLWPLARHCASLRSAMICELTYFPEQVQRENSAYEHYRELYDSAMLALKDALDDSGNRKGRGPHSVTLLSTIKAE